MPFMNNDNQNEDIDIQEVGERLDELTELVQENHKMTKSLYRRARLAGFAIAIKWIVIVGVTVGAFYYVQPMIDRTMNMYDTVFGKSDTNSVATDQNATKFDFSKVSDFFKSF